MERKSNFELLRIISMFMIVGSHLAGHGVQQQFATNGAFVVWNNGSIINKIVTASLIPGGG